MTASLLSLLFSKHGLNDASLLISATKLHSTRQLIQGIVSGDRYALSRSMTLLESSLREDRYVSERFLCLLLDPEFPIPKLSTPAKIETNTKWSEMWYDEMLFQEARENYQQMTGQTPPLTDPMRPTFRIGWSGPPGVGKSSWIEHFGTKLLANQAIQHLAVLAIDPSSSETGGALLGDKTRMSQLSLNPRAFVRPSPTRGQLGGVAAQTGDLIQLCESAGYEHVWIETVGVGQSEHLVADLCDCLIVLAQPGSGDALQAMKRGLLERADLILVTKADGDLLTQAEWSQSEHLASMKLAYGSEKVFQSEQERWARKVQGITPVLCVSAKTGRGMEDTWHALKRFYAIHCVAGTLLARRQKQREKALWRTVQEQLILQFQSTQRNQPLLQEWEQAVKQGTLAVSVAAHRMVDFFLTSHYNDTRKKE